MTTIARDSLMTLEAYSKIRKSSRADAIAHRKLRSVQLGDHITLQFEDEQTIRRQIQEMLHIEKIFDEEGINSEIEAYAPLVPDGTNWKATMLLEYPDIHERRRELARLIGVEDRMFVRFEFNKDMRDAIRAGASVKMGCDHTNYPAHVVIAADTLASLAGDLR